MDFKYLKIYILKKGYSFLVSFVEQLIL